MNTALRLSNEDIIQAWKNEDYASELREAHPLNLPSNPAGVIDIGIYQAKRWRKGDEIVANTTQCNTTYCNTTECNTTACNTTECNTTQCNTTYCNTTACNTTACATVWPSCN